MQDQDMNTDGITLVRNMILVLVILSVLLAGLWHFSEAGNQIPSSRTRADVPEMQ